MKDAQIRVGAELVEVVWDFYTDYNESPEYPRQWVEWTPEKEFVTGDDYYDDLKNEECDPEYFFDIFQRAGGDVSELPEELFEDAARQVEKPLPSWEVEKIERYCEGAYFLGENPLPVLRKAYPWLEWKFGFADFRGSYFVPGKPLCVVAVWQDDCGEIEEVELEFHAPDSYL